MPCFSVQPGKLIVQKSNNGRHCDCKLWQYHRWEVGVTMIPTGRAVAFPSVATCQASSELSGGRLGEGNYQNRVVLQKRGLILKLKGRRMSCWEWEPTGSEAVLH